MTTRLSAARKKRKIPIDYISSDDVGTFSKRHEITNLHKSSPSGINCLSLSRKSPNLFVTGGNDKIVQIFDSNESKLQASLSGHSKKVNHIILSEAEVSSGSDVIISGSADKTSRVWSLDSSSGEFAPQGAIKSHKGEVVGVSLLPTKMHIALGSADKTYSIHDLATLQSIYHSSVSDYVYASSDTHPDGTLLALGASDASIQVYDVRGGNLAATLSIPDSSPHAINTLSFSENGYHLCAPISATKLNVWDLRRLSAATTIDTGSFKIHKIKYDPGSGLYIAIAGNEGIKIYRHKSWDEIIHLPFDEGVDVLGVDWSLDGRQLWGAGHRTVRGWGASS